MRVVVNYLHSDAAAQEVVAGIEAAGGQAMAVRADVREAAAVKSMLEHRPEPPAPRGHGRLTSLTDLAGRRLAVHAPGTAPGCFARIVLRRAGLDPDRDIHTVVRAPGDYGLDLRHLRDGTIDAAFVGSTMAPEAVADRTVAEAAITTVAAELGVPATVTASEFYLRGKDIL
jgi:ABC-type nitrate/sulfonate/bicarbonate transport system substrate-binding protein